MYRIFFMFIGLAIITNCAVQEVSSPAEVKSDTVVLELPGCKQQPAPRRLKTLNSQFIKSVGQVDQLVTDAQKEGREYKYEDAWLVLKRKLDQCEQCAPHELAALYQRAAVIHYNLDDTENSILYFKKVIDQSPEIPVTLERSLTLMVAKLYVGEERYPQALDYFDKWESLCPTSVEPEYFYMRAMSEYGLERFQKAEYQVNKAINLSENRGFPWKKEYFNLLSMLKLKQGDIVGANKIIMQVKNRKMPYKPIEFVYPEFPQQAIDEGVHGHCKISFSISKGGLPINIGEPECTDDDFVSPSLAALKQFVFKPVLVEGKAIEVHKQQVFFAFALDVKGESGKLN